MSKANNRGRKNEHKDSNKGYEQQFLQSLKKINEVKIESDTAEY